APGHALGRPRQGHQKTPGHRRRLDGKQGHRRAAHPVVQLMVGHGTQAGCRRRAWQHRKQQRRGAGMSAREDIMNRIKSALRDTPETPVVPREYRRSSDMTDGQRLEQLVDRLVDYKANVFLTPAAEVPARLAELLAGSASVVVPHGLPESWLSGLKNDAGTPAVHVDSPERRLTTAELDAVDAVVT